MLRPYLSTESRIKLGMTAEEILFDFGGGGFVDDPDHTAI
jgi:hypothetical protein